MAVQPFNLIGKVMKKRADNFPRASYRLTTSIAAVIGREIATETPVDTGTARSNWIMSIDQIATYTIPAYVPYIKTHANQYAARKGQQHVMGTGDKEEQANLAAVLAQHFAAIQSYDPVRNKTIYLSNHLPYIVRLNQGYSLQTEPGFVERGFEAGIAQARKMKLLETT